MKAMFLICFILVLALAGLSCAPEAAPSVSVTEGSLSILVTDVTGGIMIQNLSTVACIVSVNSPEGEQQFQLAVGESVAVSDITRPIEVSAVSLVAS